MSQSQKNAVEPQFIDLYITIYVYVCMYVCMYEVLGITNITLLHITREFYSIKLICTNLYALFSHVKKAYTANQNCVQLFHM